MAIGRGLGRPVGCRYGMDDAAPREFDHQLEEARSLFSDVGMGGTSLRHYDDI